MKLKATSFLLFFSTYYLYAAAITSDISAVKPGPISVSSSDNWLKVGWKDGASHQWEATFSLDSSKPLVSTITADGQVVVEGAAPVYRCSTGKRRGGGDAFFDFPPRAPEGTRSFLQEFHPKTVVARTVGDRVEVS